METLYEAITRDEQQSADTLRQYAEIFYRVNEEDMFTTSAGADVILSGADAIVASVRSLNFSGEELDARMLMLGSIFGEALILAFGGAWKYSDTQGRWVVEAQNNQGETVELNIFRKLENFWKSDNEEDSVSYFYQSVRALLNGDLSV